MDLAKTSLRTRKEAEQIAALYAEELAEALVLSTPEAQKELGVFQVQPDLKPLGGK